MDILNSILTGGVAVAVITLFGQIVMWFLNKRGKSTSITITKSFEGVSEVTNIIERVINRTNVSRFLILKTENGGGRPRVGSHLYASVIYEALSDNIPSIKNDYQRLLVDSIYIKMLSNISSNTPVKLFVNKMKDGLLKSIYQREGITYSEIYYIDETDSAFYYLSVATHNKDCELDDPNDRVEIEIAVSKLRNLFNKINTND